MATLTIADLDNGKRDLQTVDAVANSRAATATTRYGQQTTTLYEAIRRISEKGDAQLAAQDAAATELILSLGFRVPVPYASGLEITDSRFTVTGPDGKVYAPLSAPFTTGAWDASQWYLLQNDLNDHKLLIFDTLVAAEAAAATLPDGQRVEIDADETRGGLGTRYEVESGALVFISYTEQLRQDLAADGGAALVGYGGGTVQTALDDAKTLSNYTELRAYAGPATRVDLTDAGISGRFAVVASGADDNAVTIVGADGRVWQRQGVMRIDPRWWGAKFNYGEPGQNDDSAAINAAYIYSVSAGKPLDLIGTPYITSGLKFSARNASGKNYSINAECVIYANLDESDDIDAVYVGDNTTNGIYPVTITGGMHIVNVGVDRISKRGYHAQDAAYSKVIATAQGFSVGAYLQGVIHSELNGNNRSFSDNALDLKIESFRSTNPVPILRFACNMVKIKDLGLGSYNKLRVLVGPDMPASTQTSGGLITFDNVRFEGVGLPYEAFPESIYIEKLGEAVPSFLGDIVFRDCWFEEFDKTKPLLAVNDGTIIFDRCFIANKTNGPMFALATNTSHIKFRDTKAYFGDGVPSVLVTETGSATVAARSNISIDDATVFYGPGGVIPKIHPGMRNESRYTKVSSDIVQMRLGSYADLTSGTSVLFPGNASDEYMTNGSLNIAQLLSDMFGPSLSLARIYIHSTDGTSASNFVIDFLPGGFTVMTYSDTPSVTLSSGVLTFPATVTASLFRPTLTICPKVLRFSQPIG